MLRNKKVTLKRGFVSTLLTSSVNAHSFIAAAIVVRIRSARDSTAVRRAVLAEFADAVALLPVHQRREPEIEQDEITILKPIRYRSHITKHIMLTCNIGNGIFWCTQRACWRTPTPGRVARGRSSGSNPRTSERRRDERRRRTGGTRRSSWSRAVLPSRFLVEELVRAQSRPPFRGIAVSYTFGMCSTSRYESTHDAGPPRDAIHEGEKELCPSHRTGMLVCRQLTDDAPRVAEFAHLSASPGPPLFDRMGLFIDV